MGKNKLSRFADNETFENVFQAEFYDTRDHGFSVAGQMVRRAFWQQPPALVGGQVAEKGNTPWAWPAAAKPIILWGLT